ncbi:MAG: T9SS type A sorting domain-containing protein [Bacteroidaceae bacterium]|nr:T9SS type A sorting domain-containing protein [Bacteroidaceae bacterium]
MDSRRCCYRKEYSCTSWTLVGEGNIYIYNISGTLVRSINYTLMSRSVDLSTLPAGYYIVVCGSQVREIVKK